MAGRHETSIFIVLVKLIERKFAIRHADGFSELREGASPCKVCADAKTSDTAGLVQLCSLKCKAHNGVWEVSMG